MLDLIMKSTPDEKDQCFDAALKAAGMYVAGVGMARPLQDYSKPEAQGLVKAVVDAFCKQIEHLRPFDDNLPF